MPFGTVFRRQQRRPDGQARPGARPVRVLVEAAAADGREHRAKTRRTTLTTTAEVVDAGRTAAPCALAGSVTITASVATAVSAIATRARVAGRPAVSSRLIIAPSWWVHRPQTRGPTRTAAAGLRRCDRAHRARRPCGQPQLLGQGGVALDLLVTGFHLADFSRSPCSGGCTRARCSPHPRARPPTVAGATAAPTARRRRGRGNAATILLGRTATPRAAARCRGPPPLVASRRR